MLRPESDAQAQPCGYQGGGDLRNRRGSLFAFPVRAEAFARGSTAAWTTRAAVCGVLSASSG